MSSRVQVRHRGRALGRDPLVVAAVVPGLVRGVPVVGEVLEELQAEVLAVGWNGSSVRPCVRLVQDRLAARQRHRPRVAEAAHAAQGAEVVVEGAVLLHQDDDVLDVLERAGAAGGGDRGGVGDAGGQDGRGGGPPDSWMKRRRLTGHGTGPPGSSEAERGWEPQCRESAGTSSGRSVGRPGEPRTNAACSSRG